MSKNEITSWQTQEPLFGPNWWNREIHIHSDAADPEKASVVPLTGAMRIFPHARADFSILPRALSPEPAPEESVPEQSVECTMEPSEPTLPDSFSQAAKHEVNPLHGYCHALKWLEGTVFRGQTPPRLVRRSVQGIIWLYDRGIYPVVSRALTAADSFHRSALPAVTDSPSHPSPC